MGRESCDETGEGKRGYFKVSRKKWGRAGPGHACEMIH